ncbi:MAG: BRO-N domain-containing protein [Bacteroidota bacterium]
MPNHSHEAKTASQLPMEFQFSPNSMTVHIELINNEPWFLAIDVCEILGLSNPTESLKALDKDEKLTSEILRSGQLRKMNFINESGLYNLIFRSNKPEAKKFRKWVTNEVLPAIRKTGSYGKAGISIGNLLSAAGINELLEYCTQKTHEGEIYYCAMQIRRLFGKQRNGAVDKNLKALYKTKQAIKVPPDKETGVWYVTRSGVPRLLNIRATNLVNISIIKSIIEGGIS